MKTHSVHNRINLGRTAKIQLELNRFIYSGAMRKTAVPLTVFAILDYSIPMDEALQLADLARDEAADWVIDETLSARLWRW